MRPGNKCLTFQTATYRRLYFRIVFESVIEGHRSTMSSVITIHQDQQEQEEFGLATLFASPPMVLKPTIVVPPPLPPKSSKGLTSTATKLDALFASESCTQPPVALSFDNEGVGLAYQSVVDLTGDDPIERLTPVRTKPV